MELGEIKYWNRKVAMYEKTSTIVRDKSNSSARPVSFYEGIALMMSKAYLQPEPSEELPYGYTAQRAA